MFSNTTIALLVALSAAAWIYSKMMRSTGSNTQSSLTTAGISGVVVFIILLILLSILF